MAGNDNGPIVFRLERTKKARHTYPLKLTQQQRETLLEHTHLSGKLKNKIEQAGEGTQVVPVTWNELHKLNDETGQAAVYARSPHKKRLMAVMSRVVKFFEQEHSEVFNLDASTPAKHRPASPPVDPKEKYPMCVEGERACPPEDCGGVWGYVDFLEAIRNPKHEEHESMLEWIGGRFDSE